ncbi:metallopeptidase family protein [Yangia mangrovi]|uniref:Metallopeptidase family protein n=1 Tax=Alloyangia mangrovi TaxID=1779329 RepID=A0A2A3JTF4_9RHOB|nr:metallopeptidase family protein [Alloyangia mangrovi]MCT4370283.1 metallopeptidase family protein [Alloyangia mangrovi]
MSDPDLASFETMARAAVDTLPAPFRAAAAEVVLRVEDWPSDEILEDMEIDDPLELTGLYEGIPVTEKASSWPSPYPDTVWLFREPILQEWRDRGNVTLEDLVTHVTVHEFAHHFGWSDEDIASVDRWWE